MRTRPSKSLLFEKEGNVMTAQSQCQETPGGKIGKAGKSTVEPACASGARDKKKEKGKSAQTAGDSSPRTAEKKKKGVEKHDQKVGAEFAYLTL